MNTICLFTAFIFLNIYLFLPVLGLHCCMGFLWLQRAGVTGLRCIWASHFSGFPCCGAPGLGTQASVVVAHVLSSCPRA